MGTRQLLGAKSRHSLREVPKNPVDTDRGYWRLVFNLFFLSFLSRLAFQMEFMLIHLSAFRGKARAGGNERQHAARSSIAAQYQMRSPGAAPDVRALRFGGKKGSEA